MTDDVASYALGIVLLERSQEHGLDYYATVLGLLVADHPREVALAMSQADSVFASTA